MRTLFLVMMVTSFFGLGIIDCWSKNWKTGIASLLLGVVQLLVFGRVLK